MCEVARAPGQTVGCDRSTGMLRRARAQVPGLIVLASDATALPFRDDGFDLATASFVLSHVRDYQRALAETLRVLRPLGMLAVTNWAPPSDPYSAAWSDCLAGAISRPESERALTEVAPWESHFSQPGALQAALSRAGFAPLRSETVAVESDLTVDQFLEDRALSSGGRLAFHLLGIDGWNHFRQAAKAMFQARFGSSFRYRRDAFIVIASKRSLESLIL